MRIALVFVGVVVAWLVMKAVKKPKLEYFTPAEFGVWYPMISDELLLKLDRFRALWGAPVVISSAAGSIGREDGSGSQHNVLRWGEVRAVDVFPMLLGGGYLSTVEQLQRAYDIARQAGFTGIGLYTDTKPGFMVHLDVRPGVAGDPAKWARVQGSYTGIGAVGVA